VLFLFLSVLDFALKPGHENRIEISPLGVLFFVVVDERLDFSGISDFGKPKRMSQLNGFLVGVKMGIDGFFNA